LPSTGIEGLYCRWQPSQDCTKLSPALPRAANFSSLAAFNASTEAAFT